MSVPKQIERIAYRCSDKPLIIVFNKTDAYTFTPKEEDDLTPKTKENVSLDELMQTWMAKMHDSCIFISPASATTSRISRR